VDATSADLAVNGRIILQAGINFEVVRSILAIQVNSPAFQLSYLRIVAT